VSRSATAILLFSRRPGAEARHKQVVPHDHATSVRVADVLHRYTQRAVDQSHLPVIESTEATQRGDTFGARLANAFADAFAAGYDRVIAVGGDCPTLHDVNWADVTAQLDAGRSVIGPTPGGGTYLIGLHRTHFDPDALEALPWKSPRLKAALCSYLHETEAAPVQLTPRRDVNTVRDLVALLQHTTAARPLAHRLRYVLGWTPPCTSSPSRQIQTDCRATTPSRGPPMARAAHA